MNATEQTQLAAKYFVDDLPGALQTGARLHSILVKMDAGKPASPMAKEYLEASGLRSLHALAQGQLALETFRSDARAEQAERVQLATAAAAEAAALEARRAEERAAASAAIFSDPEFRQRQEARLLRRKFGLGYIEPDLYPRVMRLLGQLEAGHRLRPEDAAWFQTEAEDYWEGAVAVAWHTIEAKALTMTWKSSGDSWAAINASGHWRKAERPDMSLALTEEVLVAATEPKVRSALLTTRGGALRDLDRLREAKAHAEQAHGLTPQDFRPCTLLGALCIAMHDLAAGHEWFVKAEERGASQKSIDQDIRALLARVDSAARECLREFLLERDPERFGWLRRSNRPGQVAKLR